MSLIRQDEGRKASIKEGFLMNKKISQLQSKIISKSKKKIMNKLNLAYPRFLPENEDFEIIPLEEEKYYPLMDPKFKRYRSSWSLANEGYVEFGRAPFYRFYGYCIDQVIYRSLKITYGLPDPLTVDILKEDRSDNGSIQGTGKPVEWRYLLQGKEGCCIEILSTERAPHPYAIYWIPFENKPEKLPRAMSEGFVDFLTTFYELVTIVDNEFSIKDEQKYIKKLFGDSVADLVTNLYCKNLQSGKEMIELAEEWVSDAEDSYVDLTSEGKFIDAFQEYSKKNILYISSIVFFIMALEGFINLLYKFFLKPQFDREEYRRMTLQSDLDLRILHLPVYCKGFSKADITPEDSVYKDWLTIRPFRNNLLHSNITEENMSITTFEDYFHFSYSPVMHMKRKKKNEFHTQPLYMRKEVAESVQNKVENIVYGLIEKMDKKEQNFVKYWINQILIPWYPGIEDKENFVKGDAGLK